MSELVARIAGSTSEISETIWDSLSNPNNLDRPHPFTRHAFFHALERSNSASKEAGWEAAHLLVENIEQTEGGKSNTAVGLLPLYRKSNSYGEYVFDHAWADALIRAGERYYPKLQASVPFTPVPGKRFLIADGQNHGQIGRELLDAAKLAVTQTHSSSLHITFMREDEWRIAGDKEFLLRTDQQFHWPADDSIN